MGDVNGALKRQQERLKVLNTSHNYNDNKLPSAVELILQLKQNGQSERAIAAFVGVNHSTITRIKHRTIEKIRLDVYLKLLEMQEALNGRQ